MGAPYSLRYDEESGFWGLVGPGQSWPCKWFRPAGKERHDAEIAVVELNAAFSAGAAEERARMVALCLERGQHASAAGHHLVAVAWDEVREALEREGKS